MPVTQRATQVIHGSTLDPDFETTDEHEAHGHHTALYFEDWIQADLLTHRRHRTPEGRAAEHAMLTGFLKRYEAMRSSIGPVVSPDGSYDALSAMEIVAIQGRAEQGSAAFNERMNNEDRMVDKSGSALESIASDMATDPSNGEGVDGLAETSTQSGAES